MTKIHSLICAVALICIGFSINPTHAFSDVVELRNGGQVIGSVKRVDLARSPYAIVNLGTKVQVAIPESQIARVADSENLAEYRKRSLDTPLNAEQQYELSIWCKKNQLLPQQKFHLRQAIADNPDHLKARAALGYVDYNGKWIRHAQLQKERGLISVAGKYRLPEEVAILDAQSESTTSAKKWNREIAKLRSAILRGGEKGSEAMTTLAAIDDPMAAYAIASELAESATKQPLSLRLFWIERLRVFGNRPALQALVRAGIDDPDSIIREKALESLRDISPSTAIANYLPMLKSNDNSLVRRAANALTYFAEPELAVPLIDALVTQHKREIPPGQGMNVGFGNDGSGGMTTGGKATIITESINNAPVLALLRQIEPDADFGYDQTRWRRFLADRRSRYEGDMRRDP